MLEMGHPVRSKLLVLPPALSWDGASPTQVALSQGQEPHPQPLHALRPHRTNKQMGNELEILDNVPKQQLPKAVIKQPLKEQGLDLDAVTCVYTLPASINYDSSTQFDRCPGWSDHPAVPSRSLLHLFALQVPLWSTCGAFLPWDSGILGTQASLQDPPNPEFNQVCAPHAYAMAWSCTSCPHFIFGMHTWTGKLNQQNAATWSNKQTFVSFVSQILRSTSRRYLPHLAAGLGTTWTIVGTQTGSLLALAGSVVASHPGQEPRMAAPRPIGPWRHPPWEVWIIKAFKGTGISRHELDGDFFWFSYTYGFHII